MQKSQRVIHIWEAEERSPVLTLVCLLGSGAVEQIHQGPGWSYITLTQEQRKLLARGCLSSFRQCGTQDPWGWLCDEGLLIPPAVQALYQREGIHPAREPDYCYYYYYRYSLTVGPSSSCRSTHVHRNHPHHAFILILLRSKQPCRPSWKRRKENPHTTSASLFLSLWFPVFLMFFVCLFPSKWKKTRKKVQDQGESLSPQPATSLPTLWRDR